MTYTLGLFSLVCALLDTAPPLDAVPTKEREVVLEVDHAPLLEQQPAEAAQDTAFFVRGDSAARLREQHSVIVREGNEPTLAAIIVRLAWIDYEESQYRVTVAIRRPDEAPQVVEEFECECVGSELTKAVVARLPMALEQLDEGDEPVPAESEPTESEPTNLEPPKSEPMDPAIMITEPHVPDPRDRTRTGALGWAGVAVGGVGAALVIGGLVVRPRALVTRGVPGMVEGRSPRSLGLGLAVGGGIAFIAGASMFVADLIYRRPAKFAVIPRGGPQHAGVDLTLRF